MGRQFLTDNPTAHTATKNQLLNNLTKKQKLSLESKANLINPTHSKKEIFLNNNSAPIQTFHDTSDTIGFFPSEHNPVFTWGNYPPRGKNVQKLDKGFDYQNYRVDGLEKKFFPENEGESKEEEGDVIFEVQEPANQSKSSENFENSKLSAFTNLKNSKNSASKSSNVSQKNSNNLQTTQQVNNNNKNNKNKNQNSKNSSSVFLEPEVPPEKPKLVRSTRLKNRPGYNKNNNNNNQSNKNDQPDKANLAN